MVRSNKKGGIVLISSIYGEKAQDMSMYEGTNLKENMTYLLEGIDKKVIHSRRKNLAKLEKDNFYSILEEIKGQTSSSYFQDLIELIKKYKQKYKFPRQMPWDDV
jgi:hypothetical protein